MLSANKFTKYYSIKYIKHINLNRKNYMNRVVYTHLIKKTGIIAGYIWNRVFTNKICKKNMYAPNVGTVSF